MVLLFVWYDGFCLQLIGFLLIGILSHVYTLNKIVRKKW